MTGYTTVYRDAEAEIVEKKSRFISHIFAVESEKEAAEILEGIRKKYWDARHNVYAYRIGVRGEVERYSDDGEPGGTSGIPTLEVLKGKNITNCMVVTTRYFGGVLLGTGGLVRAYTKAAQEGLKAASLKVREPAVKMSASCDYSLSGKVEYFILNNGYSVADTVYAENVELVCAVPSDRKDEFTKGITELTSAKAEIKAGDEMYLDKVVEYEA